MRVCHCVLPCIRGNEVCKHCPSNQEVKEEYDYAIKEFDDNTMLDRGYLDFEELIKRIKEGKLNETINN